MTKVKWHKNEQPFILLKHEWNKTTFHVNLLANSFPLTSGFSSVFSVFSRMKEADAVHPMILVHMQRREEGQQWGTFIKPDRQTR